MKKENVKYKLNVLGSCISRVSLLDGEQTATGIADEEMDIQYFLDKQNLVCAMMSAPFQREEVEQITEDTLWDKRTLRSLKQCLNKDTVRMLMEPGADYLVIDLYDMQIRFLTYEATCFATQADEFCRTPLFEKYRNDFGSACFMEIDRAIWYGYVDLFFEKILKRFDADHMILNRFRANTYFLNKDGQICTIPETYKNVCQPNDKYNMPLHELENYIIEKYHPWVIDLSQYFMGDQNEWDNLNGAHFEREFYRETFDQIRRIVKGQTQQKYYSEPDFFNPLRRGFTEDRDRKFDVEFNYQVMQYLIEQDDILWLNILDKLSIYAPDDPRVREQVAWVKSNS
jgi:hypothetical protein